jgi:hypothetical protein
MVGTHRHDPILNLSGASGGGRQAHLPFVPCGPRAPTGDTMMDPKDGMGSRGGWMEGGLWGKGRANAWVGRPRKKYTIDSHPQQRVWLPHGAPSTPPITLLRFLPLHVAGVSLVAARLPEEVTVAWYSATAPAEVDAVNEGTITQHLVTQPYSLVGCVVFFFLLP